ncbi:MAG: DNA polymerase IV [Candidatus Wallbacteria bacterium]|nr:DNA polymerase IV [Candidatus Wallbacteria bacterium]
MDAFFASVEVRERPELAGKPVIVGADPKGRGVVSTCSYEARRFGVHSALPIREALRRCPQGVFLPVRMELYAAVSAQVMEILGRFSPLVEPLSIDEAFLDAAGCERLFGPPREMARRIKQTILDETRLACSVGVAPNKFLAKLATELGKPDGLTVIPPEKVQEVLSPLPVQRVFGVGKRTAEVLEAMGIRTVGDIARTPAPELAARLGPASVAHMQALARGQDERRVEPHRTPKQLGSERTFEVDVDDPVEMYECLLGLAMDVGGGLRRHRFTTTAVRLKLRTEDFVTCTRTRRLSRPTDADRTIYRAARALLAEPMPALPVRLLGVTACELQTGEEPCQQTLFGPPADEVKASKVDRAADAIRERFGPDALKPAALVGKSKKRFSRY